MPIEFDQVADGIAAAATVAAAIAAAVSAYFSSKSAKVGQDAVKEAQLARKAELAPRLVLERNFSSLHLQWPHPGALDGEPLFVAQTKHDDDALSRPDFWLTNHGAGAAIELELIFDLEDSNGELQLPESLLPLGLSVEAEPASGDQPGFAWLNYRTSGGGSTGIALYRRYPVDLPNCAPGQTRSIEFPQPLLNRIFLRGLQQLDRGLSYDGIAPLILSVQIRCHTVEGECHTTPFRFEIRPYFHGGAHPIIVNGIIRELPMYTRSDEPRIL